MGVQEPCNRTPVVIWTRLGDTDANRFNIYINANDTVGFDYRSPSGVLHPIVGGTNAVSITPNTWTHLAITRSGNTYSIFRDGALQASGTDTSPDLPTSVGWQMSGRAGYFFNGSLDEVRLSSGVLTPSQFLNAASIPEPSSLTIFGLGAVGFGFFRWRRRRS